MNTGGDDSVKITANLHCKFECFQLLFVIKNFWFKIWEFRFGDVAGEFQLKQWEPFFYSQWSLPWLWRWLGFCQDLFFTSGFRFIGLELLLSTLHYPTRILIYRTDLWIHKSCYRHAMFRCWRNLGWFYLRPSLLHVSFWRDRNQLEFTKGNTCDSCLCTLFLVRLTALFSVEFV